MTQDRYLHFSNIDMERADISSQCSHCGQEFTAEPKPGERVDDVLLRVRAEFEAHRARRLREWFDLGEVRLEISENTSCSLV